VSPALKWRVAGPGAFLLLRKPANISEGQTIADPLAEEPQAPQACVL